MSKILTLICDNCGRKEDTEEGGTTDFKGGPVLNFSFGTYCAITHKHISGLNHVCQDCRAIIVNILHEAMTNIYLTSWSYRNRVLPGLKPIQQNPGESLSEDS